MRGSMILVSIWSAGTGFLHRYVTWRRKQVALDVDLMLIAQQTEQFIYSTSCHSPACCIVSLFHPNQNPPVKQTLTRHSPFPNRKPNNANGRTCVLSCPFFPLSWMLSQQIGNGIGQPIWYTSTTNWTMRLRLLFLRFE